MINVKNLHKSFGNQEILRGMALQIEKGQTAESSNYKSYGYGPRSAAI